MATKNVVLTDVANDCWLDEFHLSSKDGLQLAGSDDWSISKKTLRGGVSEGVDVVEINNGAFAISVLPTRGMGLGRGSVARSIWAGNRRWRRRSTPHSST